ncbi:EAL domain-containing protein (plasmid) [Comamonadaceae bacterium OTU4NAUVB1]|nr:EAL domain-containing protein [Comamonadaceae bacterium OTU4NAUVB1]
MIAVMNESSRGVSRNLFDTFTGAARLLGSVSEREARQASNAFLVLNRHQQEVFSFIKVLALDDRDAPTSSIPRLILENSAQPDDPPQISIIVPAEGSRPSLKGTLNSAYVWERAQSGLYTLCFKAEALSRSYCQPATESEDDALSVTREMLFRPFLDAAPWQLKATAASELTMLLPVSLGFVAACVSALAFCVAMIASSVYLRRWANSLDSFMRVTGQASDGDFSERVPVHDLKDELRDLGTSFNVMMADLQTNFEFNAVLARMDLSILKRASLEQVVHLVLTYAKTMDSGYQPMLICRFTSATRAYYLNEQGCLTFSELEKEAAELARPKFDVEIGKMFDGIATLVMAPVNMLEVDDDPIFLSRLKDLGRRLSIAAEATQHDAMLVAQANTDPLTGLLNRRGYINKLTELIETSDATSNFDVVFVDLDGFKEVNDAFGHSVGDEILRQFGQRLLSSTSESHFALARLGGDEFALLLPVNAVVDMKNKLDIDLRHPFKIDNREINLLFSMGSTRFPSDGKTVTDLLRQSDLAMYKAKSLSGSNLVQFTSDMDAATSERLLLLHELRHALESNLLRVVYQPRISSVTQRVVSVEALMRWKHPVLGSVSPAKFIPLAEESGLIIPFGFWILEESCKQYLAWHSEGFEIEHISVNVSPIQMMAPSFFEKAKAILRCYDIPAGGIELEITEGAMVQNIEATSASIRSLQEAGFHIALDDFGVGYSALSYLHQIPFDTLKIDQSFVKHLHDSHVSFAIASAIITLAKTLGRRIVAEGVELEQHAEALKELGVDELQGFLFGRPMESFAVIELATVH